jgi:hypothetical protein
MRCDDARNPQSPLVALVFAQPTPRPSATVVARLRQLRHGSREGGAQDGARLKGTPDLVFGKDYFLLPNPLYGSWQGNPP